MLADGKKYVQTFEPAKRNITSSGNSPSDRSPLATICGGGTIVVVVVVVVVVDADDIIVVGDKSVE